MLLNNIRLMGEENYRVPSLTHRDGHGSASRATLA